jgi:hypothetical protein
MSPDLKDVLVATIPSILPAIMVGFGILINKNDINRLWAEMGAIRTQLHGDINGLRSDIATLVNISNEMDKRVSRLEDKG